MDVVRRAPTGSILLLKGIRFYSKIIECASRSNWSHVVIVVQDWDNRPGETFILESSRDCAPLYDLLTEKVVDDGVRLVPVDAFLKSVEKELVVLRRLFVCNADIVQTMTCNLARELAGRRWERNIVSQVVMAWYDGPGGATRQDLSSVFCSELATELYMRAGLVPRDLPSSEYITADFGVDGPIDHAVASRGHSLSNYVVVQHEQK